MRIWIHTGSKEVAKVSIGVHVMFEVQGRFCGRIINVLLLFHASATDPKTLLHPKWQECSFGHSWVCNNKSIYDRTLDRFRVEAWRAIHLNIKSEISTHDLNLQGLEVGKELINSLESSELANHISIIRSINIWVMELALGWWIHWCAKKVPILKRAWNDTSTPSCVLSSTWLFLNSMLYN